MGARLLRGTKQLARFASAWRGYSHHPTGSATRNERCPLATVRCLNGWRSAVAGRSRSCSVRTVASAGGPSRWPSAD